MARYILANDSALDVPETATTGTPRRVDRYPGSKAVQFTGTFGGGKSMQLQGTINGTDWVNIGAAVVASGTIIDVGVIPYYQLRVNVTVAGTGSVDAVIGAHDFGSY